MARPAAPDQQRSDPRFERVVMGVGMGRGAADGGDRDGKPGEGGTAGEHRRFAGPFHGARGDSCPHLDRPVHWAMVRPTVVQFGAGSIGRGFAGQLWSDSGFDPVFVDLDTGLVDAIERRGGYPLRLVGTHGREDRWIGPARAIHGADSAAVLRALSECAFAATAIGGDHFVKLAPLIAQVRRETPLNVVLCENRTGSGDLFRAALGDAGKSVGCAGAEVGRMVPVPTPELRAEDPLLVLAEPYVPLIVDGSAWLGPRPDLAGVRFVNDLAPHHARKLHTHNGGHFVLACLARERGIDSLAEAADLPELAEGLAAFWEETGLAIVRAHGLDLPGQRAFEADLLERFRNRALGDTVERVARDPLRKLRADDRLVGAATLCLAQGIEPIATCAAIRRALEVHDIDPSALDLPAEIAGRVGADVQ